MKHRPAPCAGWRPLRWLALAALLLQLAACAGLPPLRPDGAAAGAAAAGPGDGTAVSAATGTPTRAPTRAPAGTPTDAPASTPPSPATPPPAAPGPLDDAVARAELPPGRSGIWGLAQADYALDARLALMRLAQRRIDVQVYEFGADGVGHWVLRELRDAARRGVQVRLLLDDLYTLGLDPLLAGLANEPGAQVRLFNPFVYRASPGARLWNLATDGARLNHRMHNKLMVVDGVLAVAGGRNLADPYFMRDLDANFVDLDFVFAGAVLPSLQALFDRYWHSDRVRPVGQMWPDPLAPAARREAFDAALAAWPPPPSPAGPDMLGSPALSRTLAFGRLPLREADAEAFADAPDKTFDPRSVNNAEPQPGTTLAWAAQQAQGARSEILMVSPYFLPDRRLREGLREGRSRGVRTRIITNSVASSDEPLVSFVSGRYRRDLVGDGVRLFELNPEATVRPVTAQPHHADSRIRLHAKIGVVDRQTVLVGSLNLDPRSHRINTELGIAIHSAELGGDVAAYFDELVETDAVHEVLANPGNGGLRWLLRRREGSQREERARDDEPGLDRWQQLKLQLLSLLVPDELL